MDNDIKIPIDNFADEFRCHIDANPRTFLSSKFGDGKSYFIEMVKSLLDEDYCFLTLYPVNYQVMANEDIFKLIKHDILFQMMCHGMISDNLEISDSVALWWFIQNEYKSIAENLIPLVSYVALPPKCVASVATALGTLKVFTKLKRKFNEYKRKVPDALAAEFLESVQSNSIYEEDFVTKIIKDSIAEYKKQNNEKKVVLVIEDLDRIDPAHIFRILNIFSAHIDYCYKYGVRPEPTDVIGNKFGFDNVIFVADFNNVRKIFSHFYGEQTDFNGYIGKFLSSAPYNYSIREIRANYIYDYLAKELNAPHELLKALLTEDILETKTIRECVQSFEIDNQITEVPAFLSSVGVIHIDKTILRVMSVLHRLNVPDEDVVDKVSNLLYNDSSLFSTYVAPYFLLQPRTDAAPTVNIFTKDHKNNDTSLMQVSVNQQTGLGENVSHFIYVNNMEPTDVTAVVRNMMHFVVR